MKTLASDEQQLYDAQQLYGIGYGLQGLNGRLQGGLDPAGLLAVHATRQIIRSLIPPDAFDSLVTLTNELHRGGIWAHADSLSTSDAPEVKAWFLMGCACVESNTGDLTRGEYFQSVRGVLRYKRMDEAVAEMRERAIDSYILVDHAGQKIPFGDSDSGFLDMAITGYKSGVVAQEEQDRGPNLYFVGA